MAFLKAIGFFILFCALFALGTGVLIVLPVIVGVIGITVALICAICLIWTLAKEYTKESK
jgi:membrane protein implicated in regulation of membrane protease activity